MADLCLICSELMGELKNDLNNVTQWSNRPIYLMIETFMSVHLSQNEIEDRQICQNCLIKFNDLDEHQSIVEKIQNELITLFNESVASSADCKALIKVEPFEFPLVEDILAMKKPLKKRNEEFRFINENQDEDEEVERSPKPKKHKEARKYVGEDPTGYTVTEVDGKKHYKCDICGKIQFRRLKNHRSIHTTERNVKCEVCGAMFKTKMCLWSHNKVHKKGKMLICDYCGKEYPKKYHLRIHINSIHFQRKDFTCPVCGKGFAREAVLIQHVKIHTNEKNEVCSVCGYRAYTKSAIYRHMKSHTREQKYSCEICGKAFHHSYNVTAHINHVHKGQRYKPIDETKLTCSICGLKFPRINRVKQHMAEVHNVGGSSSNYAVAPEEVVDEWIGHY